MYSHRPQKLQYKHILESSLRAAVHTARAPVLSQRFVLAEQGKRNITKSGGDSWVSAALQLTHRARLQALPKFVAR